MAVDVKKQCLKCGKTMKITEYYKTRVSRDEYPDGYLDICKKCATMHFKTQYPETFFPILRVIDHPWVPVEYSKLAEDNKVRENDPSVLGKYIAKMKLGQYNKTGFENSYELRKALGHTGPTLDDPTSYPTNPIGAPVPNGHRLDLVRFKGDLAMEHSFVEAQNMTQALVDEITKEERAYLMLKWGSSYKEDVLLRLEKLYQEMMASFDIRTPSHKDYLRKLCVVSVKADEALEIDDYGGYSSLMGVYDKIMKSANFQPIQSKEQVEGFVDSIGELVKMCEKTGFIPKFDLTVPLDIVDKTLNDSKLFIKRLFENDDTIGQMYDKAAAALEELESDKGDEDKLNEIFEIYDSITEDLGDGE